MKRYVLFAGLILVISAALTASALVVVLADETKKDDKPQAHTHDPVVLDAGPIITRLAIDVKKPRRLLADPDGSLIVVDSAAGTVLKRRPDGKVETVADGLNDPSGLARDKAGNLYVSTHADGAEAKGTIVKITPEGKRSVLVKGLTGPKGMAFDAQDVLHVANFAANSIVRIDADGKVTPFARDVPTPAALVFDKDGNLYAVNSAAGTLSKVTPRGEVSELAKGFNVPSDLALSPDGHLIVTNYGGEELSQVDLKGTVTPYARVPGGTIGLLFDPEGNLFLVNWDHQLLFKRTATLMVPCPHCKQKIPVRLKEELPKKRAEF